VRVGGLRSQFRSSRSIDFLARGLCSVRRPFIVRMRLAYASLCSFLFRFRARLRLLENRLSGCFLLSAVWLSRYIEWILGSGVKATQRHVVHI
jgi:hypothetical protein